MNTVQKTQAFLYAMSGTVLVGGLGSALYIYTHAEENPDNLSASMITGTKLYRRGLEMYGGKMNLIFNDFSQWFGSLWEGKNLAISIAVLTLAATIVLHGVARRYPRLVASQPHP